MRACFSIVMLFFVFSCKDQAHAAKQEAMEKTDTTAGKEKKTTETTTMVFNVDKPDMTWTLPDQLKEISGISWMDATHVMAIEDTHASLYMVSIGTEAKIEKTIPFAEDKNKKFDVEDVVISGSTVYTIWSHGAVFEIDNWNTKPAVTEYKTSLTKEDNTEGICVDPLTGDLLIACKGKGENTEEKKSTRAVYVFSIKNKTLSAAPLFLIKKKIFKSFATDEIEFNPSAISFDPITKNIYMLSTRGTKCLASFNRQGDLLSFQYLDDKLFPQPEGLCFSPEGVLYISSEGKTTAAVISKFSRH